MTRTAHPTTRRATGTAARPATRRLIDVGFACAIAATIALAIATRGDAVPAMPDGVVATTAVADHPRIPERVAIAAVFAEIHGPRDFTGWSVETLSRELSSRGFRRTSPSRFERADATVDVIVLPDSGPAVERALNAVLATHAVVYYNGHNFGGSLALVSPPDRIVILDSCWSAQHYASLAHTTLVANTERAITGSIFSLLPLLDGLLARDDRPWSSLLAAMNDEAHGRAVLRAGSDYPDPEHYALVRAR